MENALNHEKFTNLICTTMADLPPTRTVSVGTFVTACFATTFGVIVSVSFLTFNVFHREKRFMKMSSPKLNILISIGGIVLNIVCLLYGMDYFFTERYDEATVTCQMRLWMIMLAITMVFGPIFSKSWRVYRIFRYAGIKKVIIKDSRLFLMCGIAMCCDAVLMFLWQVIDLLKSQRIQVLEDTSSNTSDSKKELVFIQACSCSNLNVWLTIMVIWKTLFFAYGLFVAWKTRNVLLPPMKDSPSIVISVIFTMCTTSLVVVLSSLLHQDPDAFYILHILSITVCSTVVQISVFFPKVLYWWKTPIENPVRLSTSMYDHIGSHSEEEMCQLLAENRALKKTLNEKASRLSKLEANLQTAKQRLKSISLKDFKVETGCDIDLSEMKLDSGLDVDLSETTSTAYQYSEKSYNTRQGYRQFDSTYTSEEQDDDSPNMDQRKLQRSNSFSGQTVGLRNQKSRTSLCSVQSYFRSAEYYEELRENLKSKHEIVGSVAKSYNLDENEDTLSYVSSYIPLKSTRRKLNYSFQDRNKYLSPDISTTLSNDQLYPPSDEFSSSGTTIGRPESIDKPKRKKKYRTPKPTLERTRQGNKIVVRKCYYL